MIFLSKVPSFVTLSSEDIAYSFLEAFTLRFHSDIIVFVIEDGFVAQIRCLLELAAIPLPRRAFLPGFFFLELGFGAPFFLVPAFCFLELGVVVLGTGFFAVFAVFAVFAGNISDVGRRCLTQRD